MPKIKQQQQQQQKKHIKKKVETLLVKNAMLEIFKLIPCIPLSPPIQFCLDFRITLKLTLKSGGGQNINYLFIFAMRACFF